uniref:Putative chain r serine proteinase n=1 Tax=Ornithodoros turicata TaxID=34597 RepID=A0A2R5LFB0_9ACAR
MMFYMMIVLAVGAASGLNTQCNNPKTTHCQGGTVKGTRYFKDGNECTSSPACLDEGYSTKEDCKQACSGVGGGSQDIKPDESCTGAKPTECSEPEVAFFYEPESRTCRQMSGCSSNGNSFDSIEECQLACGLDID